MYNVIAVIHVAIDIYFYAQVYDMCVYVYIHMYACVCIYAHVLKYLSLLLAEDGKSAHLTQPGSSCQTSYTGVEAFNKHMVR